MLRAVWATLPCCWRAVTITNHDCVLELALLQTSRALLFVHAMGFVHAGVTTSNVLLTCKQTRQGVEWRQVCRYRWQRNAGAAAVFVYALHVYSFVFTRSSYCNCAVHWLSIRRFSLTVMSPVCRRRHVSLVLEGPTRLTSWTPRA